MLENLTLITNFIWDTLNKVILLFFTNPSENILTYAFGVYVIRKVSKLFNFIIK